MKPFKERNDTQEAVEWKPSLKEAKDLSEKLKMYSKAERNGKMWFPFELYLEKENIVSFGQFGEIQVKNPLQYHRLNEINDLRKWLDEKELQNLFQAFPEEKAAFEEKQLNWKMEIRSLLNRFKTT